MHSCCRDWQASKHQLLSMMKGIVDRAEMTDSMNGSYRLLDVILSLLDNKSNAPSYGLMMLWASQSNAIPVRNVRVPPVYRQLSLNCWCSHIEWR